MADKEPHGTELAIIPPELIERKIYLIRGKKVMLDRDLSELYGVETRALIQAVTRNRARFPADFMFQLSAEELHNWRSHIVMSNPAAKMGLRRRPYVFTELGVAMLSSILRSDRAVQMNILIMRAFVARQTAMQSRLPFRDLAKGRLTAIGAITGLRRLFRSVSRIPAGRNWNLGVQ